MKRLLNIFEFFKTTLIINLSVCAIGVVLGGFDYFFILFLSFGFLMSILFKEMYRKNDYLFYANNGVSKIQLIVASYFMTFCTTVLIGLIVFLKRIIF